MADPTAVMTELGRLLPNATKPSLTPHHADNRLPWLMLSAG